MKIVWTIAGSDSGGGAGVQADLKTIHDYEAYGCSVITALTAQNTCGVDHIQATSVENLSAQLRALEADLPPAAIKLGMLYDPSLIETVAARLKNLQAPIIADPVLVSTSGAKLYSDDFISSYRHHILPLADLITPNVHEAQALTGIPIDSTQDMEQAAHHLLHQGARAVLLKGGDLGRGALASDYYASPTACFWINLPRIDTQSTHGTGCTLSAAIASGLAQGWSLVDAIILAKAYVHAGITHAARVGQGRHPIGHVELRSLSHHFPWVTDKPQPLPAPFKKITQRMGRYPLVDNLNDLALLCTKGIQFIQLRIKHPGPDFESICAQAVKITRAHGVSLVINDHAELAHRLGAPALHLGQEDVSEAPLHLLNRDTMILGLSAHNLYELARAYAHHPSHLAIGPIFESSSKHLAYPPVGLERLSAIAALSPLPLVAIGGIPYAQVPEILGLGCSGVAFIEAAKELAQEGRYDRHFSLPNFDAIKQQRLSQATVVCVGIGGLAAGCLPYLAAAGVGSLVLIDADRVSYSNLQRQILFQEQDIGQLKVEVAARFLLGLNSQVNLITHAKRLTAENAMELLSEYDLIIDGTDNFDSHYLINDTARALSTDLIAASVFQDQGQLFYLSPHSACYRCAFPTPPAMHERPSCSLAGVLGTTPGTLGIMQAQLAIELIGNPDKDRASFCRTVNMDSWQVKHYQLSVNNDCPTCQTPLSSNFLRSMHMTKPVGEITVEALQQALEAGETIHLVDVREDDEREAFNIGGQHIPIQVLPERMYELNPKVPYVVYCHAGGRSRMACEFLAGQDFEVRNLIGGMSAWQKLKSS